MTGTLSGGCRPVTPLQVLRGMLVTVIVIVTVA